MDTHKELYQLAEQTGALLNARGEKMATAESCTGGWISQAMTAVPGSSKWFDRGFVTYSNHAKIQMLGVRLETLERYGAVSAETVSEMAAGALHHSEADWAVAVSGIAGPDGGTPEKPVGTVYLACKGKKHDLVWRKAVFQGDREAVRKQTVILILEELSQLLSRERTKKSPA